MNKNRTGDLCEVLATGHFLAEGLEVFPNVACTGPADLVVLDPETGETTLVDVKRATRQERADGSVCYRVSPSPSPDQVRLGVRFLCVVPETREFLWSEEVDALRRPAIPEGVPAAHWQAEHWS